MVYWILYTLATGEIYGPLYLGHAIEWTNIPDGCGVIGPFPADIADATVTDAYNHPNHYMVQDGKIVQVANIVDLQLADAKTAKLAELQTACTNALATFTSSALGSPHTYLTGYGKGNTDFLMLETEDRYMQSADYDGQPILWYTVDAGDLQHDKAQIHQVYLDGRAAGQAAKMKMKQFGATLMDPTTDTVAKVNAIVW